MAYAAQVLHGSPTYGGPYIILSKTILPITHPGDSLIRGAYRHHHNLHTTRIPNVWRAIHQQHTLKTILPITHPGYYSTGGAYLQRHPYTKVQSSRLPQSYLITTTPDQQHCYHHAPTVSQRLLLQL